MEKSRTVSLREERNGDDTRYLDARLGPDGELHLAGQDLGPGTWPVSRDGEHEWEHVIAVEHVPALLALLGAPAGVEILDELEARWTGQGSYRLEKLLRESDIPARFWSYP